MPYAKNLKESSYRRDADDRNDIKWAHPELVKWWVAGNADMIDMLAMNPFRWKNVKNVWLS